MKLQSHRIGSCFASILALSAVLMLVGCGDDSFFDNPGPGGATLDRSNDCAQQCVGEEECFELESGESACLTPTCEDNTAVCSIGYECIDDTCQLPECEGGCPAGTHCVYGSCIIDYNDQNICTPLFSCREECPSDESSQFCLGVCQDDASSTCLSCLDDLASCEAQQDCTANSTSCCSDQYCECYPNTPNCANPDAPACEGCAENCRGTADPNQCLSNCADQVIECSLCFEPFEECAEGLDPSEVEAQCEDEFCACIDCSQTADTDFDIKSFSVFR